MKLISRTILLTVVASLGVFGQGFGGPQGNPGGQQGTPGGPGNSGGQPGQSQGPHTSPDMPSTTPTGLVDVIIQFKSNVTPSQLSQLGPFGQVKKQFGHVNAIHMTLPVSLVKILAGLPWISYITPNRPTKSTLDIVTQTVNAPMAWATGLDGSGIGVAIIDSGIASKRDLMTSNGTASRIVYSQSFVSGSDASDQYGHGTHVAGIVGSNGASSAGPNFTRDFRGIAPNANILNFRVLDANGSGYVSDVISAIDQAIQLQSTYNIRVINLSLGTPVYESYTLDPLCQAVEAAWKAGIVVVAAAGNYGRSTTMGINGYGTIASPGNDPYVITVGAMKTNGTAIRSDDSIASYSSKGPTAYDFIVKPDLVAPGNNVVSLMAPNSTIAANFPAALVPNSYYEVNPAPGNSSDYMMLSGTSMATPVVSGAAALMLQKQPSLTPDQVKARLMKTATKVFPLYTTSYDKLYHNAFNMQSDIFTVGAGYLDINAALNSTDVATLPALSPSAVYNAAARDVSVAVNYSLTWGDAMTWGEAMTWGDSVFISGTALIWGDAMTWGDITTTGFALIWGDSVTTISGIQALAADDGDQDTPPTS
jgi:serine protease AprX